MRTLFLDCSKMFVPDQTEVYFGSHPAGGGGGIGNFKAKPKQMWGNESTTGLLGCSSERTQRRGGKEWGKKLLTKRVFFICCCCEKGKHVGLHLKWLSMCRWSEWKMKWIVMRGYKTKLARPVCVCLCVCEGRLCTRSSVCVCTGRKRET